MNKLWQRIVSELDLAKLCEGDIHPHVREERADLFHSHDNGATEFEFLNLLNALVLATKPIRVLETGTFSGLGTLAIASALKANGVGFMTTVDIDPCLSARTMFAHYGLDSIINSVQGDACAFIRSYEAPFDLAFIDSGGARLEETNLLVKRRLLAPGAIVVLHDASPHRHKSMPGYEQTETAAAAFDACCTLRKHYTIPYSRGLRLMFL